MASTSSTPAVVATPREGRFNKNAARRVRVSGKIPAVVYGAGQDSVAEMLGHFAERRAYVLKRVALLHDVTCVAPGGAFYAFMNVSKHFGRTLGGKVINDSTDFCLTALAAVHVALVMGSAFGTEGYARLSFATDLKTLGRGFDALEVFLKD